MTWQDVDPHDRALMERVCSVKELEVLRRRANGYSIRRIAKLLGITRGAVQSRLDNASRKIQKELQRQEAA